MEIALFGLLILAERNRPDLRLRRAWAGMPFVPAISGPALPIKVPVPVALAGLDLRRWAVRLTTVALGYVLWLVFADLPIDDPYDGVNALVGFYLALIGLGVLAIVAATAGRDRGEDLLAALPAGPRSRVWGWVTLLAGLALLEYAVLAGFRFGRAQLPYDALLPNTWELAQGPIMLLGGGLLGLVLARLVTSWVAVVVGVVGGIAWVATLQYNEWDLHMLAPMYEWIQYRDDDLPIYEPYEGSFAWHNAYLLGLCGLGVVAALLREPGRRWALMVTGAAVLAGTAAAGVLAVP